MRRLRNNLVIPILFLKLFMLCVKRKSSVVSPWFTSRCCRDLQNKVVADILTRRYLTRGCIYASRCAFRSCDPVEASQCSWDLLSQEQQKQLSEQVFAFVDAAQRSNTLILVPAWQQRLIACDRCHVPWVGEGNIWANKWFVLLYGYSVLTCAVATGGWLLTVLFLFQW